MCARTKVKLGVRLWGGSNEREWGRGEGGLDKRKERPLGMSIWAEEEVKRLC